MVEWQKESNKKKIEYIQNRCLRTILPVFTMMPTHAMQVESGIPPLQIWLDQMTQRAAAQLATKIDPTNPVHKHLPAQLQQETDGHDDSPPPLLVIPTKRRLGMLNKFKELTIHEITRNIPRNLEKIIPKHTLPLW